jgi:hypothetical protein
MTAEANRFGRWDLAWLLVCAAASSVWMATAAHRLSPTFDEPLYLRSGLECWRQGHAMPLLVHGVMPLPMEVGTLPAFLVEQSRGQPFNADAEWPSLLPWARITLLPFWWVLLGHGFLLGRRLGGAWGGRLATVLLAAEPTMLAHAGLLTADAPLTAALVALTYHYHVLRSSSCGKGRLFCCAAWLAVALLCKISAVVFGPLCLVAIEAQLLGRRFLIRDADRGPVLAPVLHSFLGVTVLGVVLAFCYPHGWLPSGSVIREAERLPDGMVRTLATGAARTVLRPHNRLTFPIPFQYRHNQEGHGSFCFRLGLGPQPYWYYFPLALSMKLSEGALILAALALLVRPRRLLNVALAAAALLLLYSFTSRIQIGVRLVLPVIALLLIGTAAAWARTVAETRRAWMRRVLAGLTLLLVLANVRTTAWLWPDGIASANVLGGGTETGYVSLSDSNYDWGQGLLELERYREAHGWGRVDVWHFGPDGVPLGPDLRSASLHRLPLDGPNGVSARVRGRLVAVSINYLYGCGDLPQALYFRSRTPIGRTRTYFLYDFTAEGPPTPDD